MANINIFAAGSVDEDEALSTCWCDFETYDGGNDKDNNSRIELKYSIKYGASGITRVCAWSPMEAHGRFPDGSSNKVDMPVQGVMRLNDVLSNAGIFTLNFEPNGDDTWKFHYTVRMQFSKGTLLEVKSGRFKEVSDHQRQIQEPNVRLFMR